MLHHRPRHSAQAIPWLLASLASPSQALMAFLSQTFLSAMAGPPENPAAVAQQAVSTPIVELPPSTGRDLEDSLECDLLSFEGDDENAEEPLPVDDVMETSVLSIFRTLPRRTRFPNRLRNSKCQRRHLHAIEGL